jgi:hypothetical protein
LFSALTSWILVVSVLAILLAPLTF